MDKYYKCADHGLWLGEYLRKYYDMAGESTDDNFGCPVCGKILSPPED